MSVILLRAVQRCKIHLLRISTTTPPLSACKWRFVKTDAAPDVSREIYRGPLSGQIRLVKIFSLSSSAAGVALQPYLYHHASSAGIGVTLAIGGMVAFFTFVTPLLLHWVTKKYVHVMTHQEGSGMYTAHLLTFFLRKRKVSFSKEDVTIPEIPGMFTTFVAKGEPLFVDSRAFDDLHHYGKLMGYDKPIDMKLGTPVKTKGH